MFDELLSSNPPDLPIPTEGEYVWHLEVIVVAVEIDPMSCEYETTQLSILPDTKKMNKQEILIFLCVFPQVILPGIFGGCYIMVLENKVAALGLQGDCYRTIRSCLEQIYFLLGKNIFCLPGIMLEENFVL
jgi:hypothetical protein